MSDDRAKAEAWAEGKTLETDEGYFMRAAMVTAWLAGMASGRAEHSAEIGQLLNYVRHWSDCPCQLSNSEDNCTCGLFAAIRGTTGGTG